MQKAILSFIVAVVLSPQVHAALECTPAGRSVSPEVAVSGWGVDEKNHRFVPGSAAGINRDNVSSLQLKWVFGLPDTDAPRFVPLVSDDTVIVSDGAGMVYALDRDSGCVKWRFDADGQVRTAFRYMAVGDTHGVYFGNMEGVLFMVDLTSGDLLWRSDLADHPRAMLSGSGIEHDGVIYQPVSS